MPTVCRTYHSDDNASAAAALKVSLEDDYVLWTIVPDDDDWEKTAEDTFAWYCWIYHASYGMMDVAEDNVNDAAGDIQCAALWGPAAMTLGAGCRFAVFFLVLLWQRGISYAVRVFRLFAKLEAKRHEHGPTAHHLVILGGKVQGKGVGSKLIKRGIARATTLGLPCYLESSNPLNVPFYERNGFRVVELLYPFENDSLTPLQGKGAVITLMVRDAEEPNNPSNSNIIKSKVVFKQNKSLLAEDYFSNSKRDNLRRKLACLNHKSWPASV